jgi:hypothetical protein
LREGERRESVEREAREGRKREWREGDRRGGGCGGKGLRYLGFVLYLLRQFSLTCPPLKIGVLTEAVMLTVTTSVNDGG